MGRSLPFSRRWCRISLRGSPRGGSIVACLVLFLAAACGEEMTGPESGRTLRSLAGSVTSAEADLEDRHTGSYRARYPDFVCTLDGGPVVIEGSVDIARMDAGWAAMIGLIDKGFHETDPTATWGSGAYAYFGHIGGDLRIGPSDGFLGGELNQVGANVAGVFDNLPYTVDFTLTIDAATKKVTVTYGGTDYTDDYGEIEDANVVDAYPGGEFDDGAIIGVDIFDTPTDVTYRLKLVSGCTGGDDEGPPTTNVTADPNPVENGAMLTLTADVDDAATGGSEIASAEYTLDGGTTWSPMGAADGMFDEVAESVTASFAAPSDPGIYDLCVRGEDTAGNVGAPECASLVVYDPSGGFVSGGGWFTSRAGAYDGTGAAIRVDANPDDGWAFNAEPPYVTPADFSAEEASIGIGSLHVEPITNGLGNDAKFILRYVPDSEILTSDFDGFSIDFLIDDAGTSYDANQFYVNLYTLTPDPADGGWYDCRFDYVATGGSTFDWTPLSFDATTSKTAGGDKIGGACPATIDGMPAGSTVLFLSVNLGDTSGNDTGVGGYFDNATLTVAGSTTIWDFEPGLGGRASFGFVSRYKKGADIPDGNTQFTFQAGDLSFHSTSYDWLVVTGGDYARFKGEGTINGVGPYRFMLWAGDDEPDTFRIKIWSEDAGDEVVVYDNGMDQPIEGGNIIVHDGKGN